MGVSNVPHGYQCLLATVRIVFLRSDSLAETFSKLLSKGISFVKTVISIVS